MSREEFLEKLERHLRGELSEDEIKRHVEYYRTYIAGEAAKGQTEEEIMNQLGDPWLIAKTLIESGRRGPQVNSHIYEQGEDGNYIREKRRHRKLDLTTWYGKLIAIAAAALVLFLLITIVSALIPVAVCLLIVGVIVKTFKK